MLINQVYNLLLQLSSKDGISGYLPAAEFSNYCNLAQLRAINELVKMLDYNQKAIDLISDVIKVSFINKSGDIFPIPSDYYRFVAASANFADKTTPCDLIGKSERRQRIVSQIVQPTADFPVISEDRTGFTVDPSIVSRIELSYAFLPEPPEWVAEVDTIPPVFDPDASTDFVLSEKFKNYLVKEIANMFGIETRDPNLQQATLQNIIEAI
jgi:hypothetical protein